MCLFLLQKGLALLQKDLALLQKDLALLQKDLALLQKDLALLQKDLVALLQNIEGFSSARIRKPATLIFGFWQGKIGICPWEACGSCKNGAYYLGLDIVGVCGAGYEHPGCWGLHI